MTTPRRTDGQLSRMEDMRGSQATEHLLSLASRTLDSMREGLTQRSCREVCRLLLPETTASAVAMTDRENVLAFVGALEADYPPGSPIHTAATLEVLETGMLGTFETRCDNQTGADGRTPELPRSVRAGIVVPINVQERPAGTIKFYYRSPTDIDRIQLAIARGFGQLLSAQLSTHELDRQAELTAKAEVKALQAQINPHFLFNTINTIAALTRTDPAQARDLLREFAVFYRQTLESSEQLIALSHEFEQTRRYLKFEHARFGKDRIVERETIAPGIGDILVPAFIVQPIVENAVRHAMRDEGALHIDIRAEDDDGDVLIAVTDDGLGMSEETCRALKARSSAGEGAGKVPASDGEGGAGIALRNVAERLERFYGFGSGIDIVSKLGEGTCVTLRFARAAVHD